jgi:hypothetical protein
MIYMTEKTRGPQRLGMTRRRPAMSDSKYFHIA